MDYQNCTMAASFLKCSIQVGWLPNLHHIQHSPTHHPLSSPSDKMTSSSNFIFLVLSWDWFELVLLHFNSEKYIHWLEVEGPMGQLEAYGSHDQEVWCWVWRRVHRRLAHPTTIQDYRKSRKSCWILQPTIRDGSLVAFNFFDVICVMKSRLLSGF